MDLVYKNEKTLFVLMLVLSLLVWAGLVLGLGWAVLSYALMFFLFYCFAQSALISYIKGTGVRITAEQFPDLDRQILACCAKLGLEREPEAYLLQMGGSLNAFATRFLGRDFLVLYTDVVDGLHDNPDALNFYIGHEIGHIKRKHLSWATVLLPASMLPLVGAAYSRAREYTCDRHGLAACEQAINAEFGMAALAAGGRRWRTMNKSAYIEQSRETEGFWMSFHELVGDYPWLVKRMAAVRALAAGQEVQQPRRHWLAALMALFVPRMGAGGAGGVVVLAVMAGILAAVGIPAYQAYQQKAVVASAYAAGQGASAKVEAYLVEHGSIPTLAQAGVQASAGAPAVRELEIDPKNATLRVLTSIETKQGAGVLVFEPSMDEEKNISWACSAEGIMPDALPEDCR
ncbi:M48 family metalloprotease [Massilia sp.]|uniref:M48 family metalloprotease n=1 Tax=Massilia sp. TaxID=1882437 RepID=UPI000EC894EE|nr:M48 family metalloprotease [Massilia sp.]HBZ05013.1 peptidase M48 family protein [Massilia sp.]